jgi:crotonobetainyl-CoA:carnitine CoA-transferase CaiB-like acyl-CoA transferase
VSGPLDGARILDLTRLLPGNYCTLLLADLGADVIKIEEPGRGDYIRWTPPMVDGEGAIHRALNRGKRSVTIDLKVPYGVDLLKRLARDADAVVESYRPGVMDRLGVGADVLTAENPRLVFCSVTGYGQDGPYRDRVGHDINYTGIAGVLHAAGPPDGSPTIPSVQVGDFGGGMAAALGLVAGLGEAARTGRGRTLDVSMLDVAVSWAGVLMSWFLATGRPPPRGRMPLAGGLACYRVYRCADGAYLAVGALEARFWRALCEALEVPELVDAHLDPTRQDELAATLQGIFGARPRDAWVAGLSALETCVSPVNDVAEALHDPQVLHRGLLAEIDGRGVGPGPAIRLSGEGAEAFRPAPGLGEHTDEVLEAAGLSTEEVGRLRRRGVV